MKLKLISRYKLKTHAAIPENEIELDQILNFLYGSGFREYYGKNQQRARDLVAGTGRINTVAIEIGNPFLIEYATGFNYNRRDNIDIEDAIIISWAEFKREFMTYIPELGNTFHYIDFSEKKIMTRVWTDSEQDKLLLYFENTFPTAGDAYFAVRRKNLDNKIKLPL